MSTTLLRETVKRLTGVLGVCGWLLDPSRSFVPRWFSTISAWGASVSGVGVPVVTAG